MAPDLRPVDQLGMDERVVTDDELVKLLEKRMRLGDDRAEIGKAFRTADAEAKERIATHQIDEGGAIRVGRFRVTKRHVEARHVEFDAAETQRITIDLWGDSE